MKESSKVEELTLDQALELNSVSTFQYRILLMCGFAFMADSLEVNLLSFLSTCAGDEWDLDDTEKASITGSVFAGVFLGTLFWGEFSARQGRRRTFIVGCWSDIFPFAITSPLNISSV
jgi:MFS family permease